MEKYKTIFFDLDDTLINNKESMRYSFLVILNYLGVEYSDALFDKWCNFEKEYWGSWESGKMILPSTIQNHKDKVDYLRANRFKVFFQIKNVDIIEAISMNELYCDNLGVNIIEIDGARDLIKLLYDKKYDIIIATNGAKKPAIEKLEKIKVRKYISHIVCSDETLYTKPTTEYFHYLFQKTKDKDKSKMLIMGDSLKTDILGGIKNGIDTCWYNPNNIPKTSDITPTMTVNKLLQLTKKIEKNK